MIEYDRFIYLDVYRTGSTHVLRRLAEATSQDPIRFHRHAAITKGRPFPAPHGKTVFTTVRNPWDWYVSLWASGAGGGTAIRRYLLAHAHLAEVEDLYDQSRPEASFRRWLGLMHDPGTLNRIMEEHLPQSGLAALMGLYTYRFLRVTTYYPRILLRRQLVRDPPEHLRRFRAYGEVLRTETLDGDLDRLLDRFGLPCTTRNVRRANVSERSLASYRDYYDDEARDLVARRDRLFIDEFGYRF